MADTPLEVDIYAHANSTCALGSRMLNGIGGSGDFLRNAKVGPDLWLRDSDSHAECDLRSSPSCTRLRRELSAALLPFADADAITQTPDED